ncbi:hypothetical protein AMECASPLE_018202 [Ameca splendens]|uniref:Uncharacterized protein n=1 Tax=Ameca splendens TaxID=208324 RepID=A0ABV0Z2A7_9TELE
MTEIAIFIPTLPISAYAYAHSTVTDVKGHKYCYSGSSLLTPEASVETGYRLSLILVAVIKKYDHILKKFIDTPLSEANLTCSTPQINVNPHLRLVVNTDFLFTR